MSNPSTSSNHPSISVEAARGRLRANTASSSSSRSRFRSLSGLSESYATTIETAQTSVGSHDSSGYFPLQDSQPTGSSSRLHSLIEASARAEIGIQSNGDDGSRSVHPDHSPPLSAFASSSNLQDSQPRFRLGIPGRSSTPSYRSGPESSDAAGSAESLTRSKRRFLPRALSELGRKNANANRLDDLRPPISGSLSANTSTSSFRPPTPASPYALVHRESEPPSSQSSLSNVNAQVSSPRLARLRRLSNLGLSGRGRSSTVSAGSPIPSPVVSSRAASPMPGQAVSNAGQLTPKRQTYRNRSASEPLRHLGPVHVPLLPGIDYFDLLLPRELRVLVFSTLVRVCIGDLEAMIAQGSFAGDLARNQRWVGRAAGVRELVKCSRVCKTWHALVFDSQLWQTFNLPVFGHDSMTTPGLLRILSSAWALKQLDLTGMANFAPAGVIALADATACFNESGHAQNGLTHLNLTGCRSITANSLHYLLSRSPYLRFLRLPGLRATTNSLFDVLAACVYRLNLLDVNGCPNAEACAVLRLSPVHSDLVDLRMSGLRNADDTVLAKLGVAFANLQRLDMRNAVTLTNEGVRQFVAWSNDSLDHCQRVVVNDRPRRLTRLRHLALSGCQNLSDVACEALAGTCPDLVALELSGIGANLQLSGLIALLKTTPGLQKLDLDGATGLQDRLLPAINSHAPKLSHLVLSGCTGFTERALVHFTKHFGIPGSHEAILELDNTAINETVLRELVLKRRTVAELVAVDCRAVGRGVPNDVAATTRPRRGIRGWKWRQVDYHDDAPYGPREMDPSKTILKTFGTLSLLDAADHARTARRRRLDGAEEDGDEDTRRPRWSRSRSRSESGCTIS